MTPERLLMSNRCAVVLFLCVVVYMFWFVLSSPVLGYANSYDFVRQSSCVGLWQFIEGVDKTAGNYQFPSTWLLFDGDRRAASCMRSVDNVFPWLATLWHTPGALLSITQVALGKLLFLTAGTGLLLWLAGPMRLPVALVFALIFSNWAYLAYANTLYLEFSVLVACFWVLAASSCLLAGAQRPHSALLALLTLGLFWLGLSKQQYTPLAAVMAAALALLSWLRWRSLAVAAQLGACAAFSALAFAWLNPATSPMMTSIDEANKTNTYFGAVLPAATAPQAALRQLRLPDHCQSAIGTNWYSAESTRPCPQVVTVSRSQLPGLFVSQPSTLLVPMYNALLQVRPFYPDYLGLVAPADEIEGQQKLASVQPLSFTTLLAKLPQPIYLGLIAILALCALGACGAVLAGHRWQAKLSPLQRGCLAMLALGALTAFYALFSAVFGDGYIELVKHAVAFGVGLGFALISLPIALIAGVRLLSKCEPEVP